MIFKEDMISACIR